MQVIINIDDSLYDEIVKQDRPIIYDSTTFSRSMVVAIRNSTPLPNNATNGDMIEAMFPWECRDIDDDYKVSIFVNDGTMRFNKDWWYRPYHGGDVDADSNCD